MSNTNTNPNTDIAWIERLPNGGGDWGRGIIGTVSKLDADVVELEASKLKLDAELSDYAALIKQQKVEIDASIKAKRKLIRKTTSRANAEVTTMFADVQIASARHAQSLAKDLGLLDTGDRQTTAG
jgi:hypothetical protein